MFIYYYRRPRLILRWYENLGKNIYFNWPCTDMYHKSSKTPIHKNTYIYIYTQIYSVCVSNLLCPYITCDLHAKRIQNTNKPSWCQLCIHFELYKAVKNQVSNLCWIHKLKFNIFSSYQNWKAHLGNGMKTYELLLIICTGDDK